MKRFVWTVMAVVVLGGAIALLRPAWICWRFLQSHPRGAAHIAVPVAGARAKHIADTWGGPRSGGRKHEGVDIFAARGTPVVASTEAVVLYVGTNRLGGKVVWLLAPGGERHYYAHLDAYAPRLRRGMRLAVGDVVGQVGTTGNARGTPPHLHFGIYQAVGGATNPWPRLQSATGR